MLLSRVAESLYWINRYLERAENISRFVEVSEAMSLDCPPGSAEPWLPLIDASSDRESFDKRFPEKKPDDVINFLIRDRLNPNSIISCIQMARENARQIRDVMTTEMWEQINILYWNMQEGEAIWNKPRQEQLSEIRRECQLFYGITDATLSKDLAWRFSILGRLIERADRLEERGELPLIIIDAAEINVEIPILQFPLWLAFAGSPNEIFEEDELI